MIQRRLRRVGRTSSLIVLLSFAVLGIANDATAAAKTRAIGGVRLIEALEGAPASLVAEVGEVRALGGSGYGATLVVEMALRSELEPGEKLDIAWEELSPARAPRFRTGERVLVALDLLPGSSIWLARLPDSERRKRTLTVAMNGNAFLRSPSQASVLVLEHYLALPREFRQGGEGIGYLAQLATRGEIPLATDAVAKLGAAPKLAEWATGAVARQLVTALVRPDAPSSLQDALVEVIARRELSGLREPLTALATRETPAPPVVYAALAALDGGLGAEQTERLLGLGPGPYREVVARHAGGPAAERDLRSLIASDPSAEVRTRAIERLVVLRGEDAAETVASALYDREARVRGTAAMQLGELGDPAIPALQGVVDSSDLDAARAAVAGLAIIGTPESSVTLLEIAANHPEESIRNIATLAIGGKIGHD